MGQPIYSNQTSGTKINPKSPYYTIGEDLKGAINPKGVGVFHPGNTHINNKGNTGKMTGNTPSSSVSKNVGGQEIKTFKNEGGAYIYDPESIRKLRQMDFTPDHIIKMLELSQNKNTNTAEEALSLEEDNDRIAENKETKPFSHSRTLRENAIRVVTRTKSKKEGTNLIGIPLSVVIETQPIVEKQKGRTVLRHAVINKSTTKTTDTEMEYAQKKVPSLISLQPKILEQAPTRIPEPVSELIETPLGENIQKENKRAKTSPFLERTSIAFVSEQENLDDNQQNPNKIDNQNSSLGETREDKRTPVIENTSLSTPSGKNIKEHETLTAEVILATEEKQKEILSKEKAEKLKNQQEANVKTSHLLYTIITYLKGKNFDNKELLIALLLPITSGFTSTKRLTQNTSPKELPGIPTPTWQDSVLKLQDFIKNISEKNNESIIEQFVPSYKIDKNNPSLLEGIMTSSCYEVLYGETFKLEGTEDSESRRELGFLIKNLGMLLDATEVILREKYDAIIKNYADYLTKNPKITVRNFLDEVKNSIERANVKQRK